MAQLIFVHGVATRSGPALDLAEKTMADLFARTVFRGVPFTQHAPRWGDFVPPVPKDVYRTDDVNEVYNLGIAPTNTGNGGGSGDSAADLMQSAPRATLDGAITALLEEIEAEGRELSESELELFAKATDAVGDDAQAAALASHATTDDALVHALTPDAGTYGILSPVRAAIDRITGRVRQTASELTYGLIRNMARPAVGFFAGDVFAYLHLEDLREKIQAAVRQKVSDALAARTPNEALIVVAHSMGGVIMIDMLSDLAKAGLPEDLKVDCLITVGSQPGLFRAVGALTGGAPNAGEKAPKPGCVGAWYNVFDPLDPLAFRAAPIFNDVRDLTFDSATGVISAHTTYFKRPQFYARTRKRLIGLGLIR